LGVDGGQGDLQFAHHRIEQVALVHPAAPHRRGACQIFCVRDVA
jgi:hypothetical protein